MESTQLITNTDAGVFKIYRYKFTEPFMEELLSFSKIHQFDDRKSFKEAWHKWTTETTIKPQIDSEIDRLQQNGYEGDILKKMFHSARFYFRKKDTILPIESPIKPLKKIDPEEKAKHNRFTKPFLKTIDQHIMETLTENKYIDKDQNTRYNISPSLSYEEFCEKHKSNISDEFKQKKTESEDLILSSLKKTYKNRFYNIKMTVSKTDVKI